METDSDDYKLRCELTGHEDDVRGICVCGNVGIATSSRDKTVRFWNLDGRKYAESKILLGHTSFVGPLAWISPDEEYPEGGIVSGGMDTLVIVWDLRTGEKVQTLKGHEQQVTGIVLDNGDIVSSSLDCTLRRWRNGQVVESWGAHNAAIQSVIKLPSGELVTGSSDASLKLWRGKSCLKAFLGHTDTVRSLSVMSDLGVLSASHDGSIRLWALSGQTLMEMVGHTSIVYSVDSHASGLIVSGSEDCLAKIWKDGTCVQSIEHPGCVWDVKFLENGDIVTACSDGVVRVWTANHERIAEPQELESFASRLSQYKLKRKRVGGLKLEELPGMEALQIPGTSNGQTKVIREGDNGVAYSWNTKDYKWDKIGEVVDGPDDNRKNPVLDGAEYDYVFDVDIGDGQPIRKLPYNLSDDPYTVADKWLLKEDLPLAYRQQVVEFILQNSGKKNVAPDPSFRDPYTGSSAYVPGGPSNVSADSHKPIFKHIPKKGVLVFDVAQFDGILKKIVEFNNALLADSEKKNYALPELEVSRLGAIVKILKDTSHYHSTKFVDADVVLLLNLLRSWPRESLFPVIDMLRMTVLHPDGAILLLKLVDSDDILPELIHKVTTAPVIAANLLTSIRLIANLFKNAGYYNWLQKRRSEILDAFSSCYSSANKAVQLSFSTLILKFFIFVFISLSLLDLLYYIPPNQCIRWLLTTSAPLFLLLFCGLVSFAVLLIEKNDVDGQGQVLSAALEIVEEENLEVDSKFRALVAIGSLMLEGGDDMKRTALDFDVESIARKAKTCKDAKIAEVGADIEVLTKDR